MHIYLIFILPEKVKVMVWEAKEKIISLYSTAAKIVWCIMPFNILCLKYMRQEVSLKLPIVKIGYDVPPPLSAMH